LAFLEQNQLGRCCTFPFRARLFDPFLVRNWYGSGLNRAGQHQIGTAVDFDQARADFEAAWRQIRPTLAEAHFQKWRDQRDFTAWKYSMWDARMRLPTQWPGLSRSIAVLLRRLDRYRRHRRPRAHGPQPESGRRLMKFATHRPYSDPDTAARKLIEIANSIEAV
jgi:hypothetical protein